MDLNLKVEDWYEIHNGFELTLHPGFTAIVGPNGAGKTTLLLQIEEYAKVNKIPVWRYSNLREGHLAKDTYLLHRDYNNLATVATSSEGECVAINFSNKVNELGQAVQKAVKENTSLIILLDAIDSGASIDRARDLRHLFDLIADDAVSSGQIYLVMAVNHYELAKATVDCVNARSGDHLKFETYDDYAEFICNFFE